MVCVYDSGSCGPGSRLRALVGITVLCSWAIHFIFTVRLSTQVCKWVPANLRLLGNPVMD